MVEEQRAGHVVEGVVPDTGALDVRAYKTEPVERASAEGVRQRAWRHIERRHAQIEPSRSGPGDERAWYVGRAAGHIEHGDPLTGSPRPAERVEPRDRGLGSPKSAIHE